ncbi:MAG TPA: secretin N-terminal domain-containing protein [Pyrinomonadaceae bacterium]|jgi:general secretion pathway protein D
MARRTATHASPAPPRAARTLLLALCAAACLFIAPGVARAQRGAKNYKQGLRHEQAQQWERAAEEFALAVASDPASAEYQLHYRRALFNASQTLMMQGRALGEQGDYTGAFNAFRRAAGYDPQNELALALMERMLRLQLDKDSAQGGGARKNDGAQSNDADRGPAAPGADAPAVYRRTSATSGSARQDAAAPAGTAEPLRVINYSGDLEEFIRFIAKQVNVNVVFERDFPKREVKVELSDVTAAQALDHVFVAQGLFFQRLSRHTILVADASKRPQYQQLVVRTFYLSNADPADAQKLIQTTIPPQAGRQTVVAVNKATNSMTVRDTPENMRLIAELLKGMDKGRAEVVIDVNIYEVSRSDLMQLGNQLGTDSSLLNLGGLTKGFSILGGSREVLTAGAGALTAPTALGAALVFPSSSIAALQRREHTRLLASTQLHAFDSEKSTAHIGQRVPVQTANVTPYYAAGGDGNNAQGNVNQGVFGGNGYPVIQYEKTGLTLEFTPQVFQNLDVQVRMTIKSNDVANQGATTLTPVFTERNIEGMARIQNNHTMMIASVAQNQQSRGRQGLPVLGLVPVLGQFFTAPRRNDQQTDIIIAVTPHVLRAPSITSADEQAHPSGSLQLPDSDSLQALLDEIGRDEQIAAARSLPTNAVVEVTPADAAKVDPADAVKVAPGDARNADAPDYTFVPAPKALAEPQPAKPAGAAVVNNLAQVPVLASLGNERPATSEANAHAPAVAPAQPTETGNASPPAAATSAALLRLSLERPVMRVGERQQLRVFLKTDAPLELVSAALRFDPAALAVRAVTPGTLFPGAQSAPAYTHSVNGGALRLSVMPAAGAQALTGAGVLLVVELEALKTGPAVLDFTAGDVLLLPADGRKVVQKLVPAEVSVQ